MEQQVKALVLKDPSLSQEERSKLEVLFKDDKFFDKLMQGAMGASVAYAIVKFLKLSRPTQIILTAAGFGIGRTIADNLRDKHFPKKEQISYDKKTHVNTVNI